MRRTTWVFLGLATALAAHALAEDAPSGPDPSGNPRVFAKVGSETITVGELDRIIAARSPYARKRIQETDALRELADAQVESELFYQGAEKLGYADDPDVRRFVEQTLVKAFVRKEFEEARNPNDVSDEEIRAYYEEHPDQFRRAPMRRARHILVASKKEALEIRERLGDDPKAKFRKLAKEHSLDGETNVRGGDLLYFTEDGKVVGRESSDTVDARLVAAAFALKDTGQLSDPVDMGDGKWSVLELTGIRPEQVQSLEQVSTAIRRQLWREERGAALDAMLVELRTELKPEIYPERLDAIVLDSGDPSSSAASK
jgi:parvulin-like peptidyl-prolyl isomerase